jgi:AraC-like DNA-binding protein
MNRRMLRARDAMDRRFADRLDVPALAAIAHLSETHFARVFRSTFGETPHRYLQRRRIERASAMLRDSDLAVVDVCTAVGFTSLSTFTRTFREIVGETPAAHRVRPANAPVPTCFQKSWMRPA